MVDLQNQQVTIFQNPNGARYEIEMHSYQGTICPQAFVNLTIKIETLFGS